MERRASFVDNDIFDEHGDTHQQVRRTRAGVPLPVSIPSTPTHSHDRGSEINNSSAAGAYAPLSIGAAPILTLPTLHESVVQIQHQQQQQQQQYDQQTSYASSRAPPLYDPDANHHHSGPHGDPFSVIITPSSSAPASSPSGSSSSGHWSQFPLMSRNAQLRKQREMAGPTHQPIVPLDAVDELSVPTAVTTPISISRSNSHTGLAAMFAAQMALSPSHSRFPSSSSSPPEIQRTLSGNIQRSPPGSSSSNSRAARNQARRDRHDREEERLLSQMQFQADMLSAQPTSPSSGSFRRAGYSTMQLSSAASNSSDSFPRSSSYSHNDSPSTSLPPSPRSARVLQSIKDSFTSGHSHHSANNTNGHGHSHTHSLAHHVSAPLPHTIGEEERKECTHTSAAAAAAMNLHANGAHPTLHHSHSMGWQASRDSFSGVHRESSQSGNALSSSGYHRDSMSMSHSQLPAGFDHLTLADDSPELSVLSRSPSTTSSTAPTQTHSPISQHHASMSASARASSSAAPPRSFYWTSYQFEPEGSQHISDAPVAVPWQPQSQQPPPAITEIGHLSHAQNSPSAANGTTCAVCLSDGCDAFLLPCNHSFHAACILQWVESEHQQPSQRLSCPLCRQSIEQFVPLEDSIQDENGELLSRFLAVWEKHYYQRGRLDDQARGGGAGAGEDDGETLIKPGNTQSFDYPQKQQQQIQQDQSTQMERSFSPTATPAQSPFDSTVDNSDATLAAQQQQPVSAEHAAWQQMFEDVFLIPDSLPDDFIIPNHTSQSEPMTDRFPISDEHSANIAAVDGGRSNESSGNISNWLQTPLSLLSSFMSAFKNSNAQQVAAHRPAESTARHMHHLRAPRAQLSRSTSTASLLNRSDVARKLFGPDERSTSTSPKLEEIAEHELPPRVSPPPALYTPVLAGAGAAVASQVVHAATHMGAGPAFAPSPLYASMPAVAAYFTSYELMKQELGLTHSLQLASEDGDMSQDPRAALLNPRATANYFAAASTAGAVSQGVKIALTPGVMSLASAFATTSQISVRMGIQFSVFEQTKNAFALYRHRRVGEELSAAEVLVAASLGGIVAASVMYPLQHLFPLQHWTITAPIPPSAAVPGVPGPSGIGAMPRVPTLMACLGRFLPACVATAVTYEYAYRFIRTRTREALPSGTASSSSRLPSAAASASAAAAAVSVVSAHGRPSSPPSDPPSPQSADGHAQPSSNSSTSTLTALWSSSRQLIDSIASRTSSLLHSVGVHRSHEEIVNVIPLRVAGTASAVSAVPSLVDGHSATSSTPMRLPPPHPHLHGAVPTHTHAFGTALPVIHSIPAGLIPASSHRLAQHSSANTSNNTSGSTLVLPSNRAFGLLRSTSHPALSTLRFGASKPPPALDPW
jgi:hypothetical protein